MVISFYANKLWWDTADFASLPVNLPDGYNGQDRDTGDGYWFDLSESQWRLLGEGFLPTDLTGLKLWFDANDPTTITDDGGGLVSQWNDKSGGANNVLATGNERPLVVADVQNGKPVIRFDGITNFMEMTPFTQINQPVTIAIVCNMPTNTNSDRQVFDGVEANPQRIAFLNSNDSPSRHFLFAGGLAFKSTNVDRVIRLFTLVYDGASSNLRIDSANIATADPGSNSTTGIKFGLEQFGTGPGDPDICEFVFYDRILSTQERTDLENYLQTKWRTP